MRHQQQPTLLGILFFWNVPSEVISPARASSACILTVLAAAVGNAVLVFVTFLFSLPAMVLQTSRTWLKIHGVFVAISAIFTLVIGLDIWFDTLRTRGNLLQVWTSQTPAIQSLLQSDFNCCGYLNSTSPLYVTDSTCTSAFVAASKLGCVGPFSSFANNFLDVIFTGAFGVVGMLNPSLITSTIKYLQCF
jgi:hypothetical protein